MDTDISVVPMAVCRSMLRLGEVLRPRGAHLYKLISVYHPKSRLSIPSRSDGWKEEAVVSLTAL